MPGELDEDAAVAPVGTGGTELGVAGTVIVVKRSLSPGFAGIPNPLFIADNALLLFADAKEAMLAVAKSLGGK